MGIIWSTANSTTELLFKKFVLKLYVLYLKIYSIATRAVKRITCRLLKHMLFSFTAENYILDGHLPAWPEFAIWRPPTELWEKQYKESCWNGNRGAGDRCDWIADYEHITWIKTRKGGREGRWDMPVLETLASQSEVHQSRRDEAFACVYVCVCLGVKGLRWDVRWGAVKKDEWDWNV